MAVAKLFNMKYLTITIDAHFYGLSFMVLNFPPDFITPQREPQLACAA